MKARLPPRGSKILPTSSPNGCPNAYQYLLRRRDVQGVKDFLAHLEATKLRPFLYGEVLDTKKYLKIDVFGVSRNQPDLQAFFEDMDSKICFECGQSGFNCMTNVYNTPIEGYHSFIPHQSNLEHMFRRKAPIDLVLLTNEDFEKYLV